MESPKRPEEVDVPMPGETRVQQVSQEWRRNGEQMVQVFKSALFSARQGELSSKPEEAEEEGFFFF